MPFYLIRINSIVCRQEHPTHIIYCSTSDKIYIIFHFKCVMNISFKKTLPT